MTEQEYIAYLERENNRLQGQVARLLNVAEQEHNAISEELGDVLDWIKNEDKKLKAHTVALKERVGK